jgi:predicted nucleic acid-binding protein
MKGYWDSSALVKATMNPLLRSQIESDRGFTRSHSLAEVFSALTAGNLSIRLDADDAANVVISLLAHLDFVEITAVEIGDALKAAKRKGVRGGRVHDYLHAIAAEKSGAAELLTCDRNDFVGLSPVPIRQV